MTKTVMTSAMEAAVTAGIVPEGGFEKIYGGFNDYPPNMVQITEGKFWRQMLSYSPRLTLYRQMLEPRTQHRKMYKGIVEPYWKRPYPGNNGPATYAKLYIYDQHLGLMVTDNHEGTTGDDTKVRYWEFKDHEPQWEGVREESYMHYHVSKCKICGMKQGIDSSG